MHRRRHLLPLRWVAVAAVLTGCVAPAAPPRIAARPPVPIAVAPAPASPRSTPDEPAEITSDCGISQLRESMLRQVNLARAAARSCGAQKMKPTRPLVWSRQLAEAAEQHSVDMVARRYFEHASPEGKRVGHRVTAQAYKWRAVGENLAGGDTTVAGVMNGWLGSPEHCQNVMNPSYTEVGVACVRQPGSKWGNYWTMVLAARR